eukprot:4007505-Prymnesium_polylepis.1
MFPNPRRHSLSNGSNGSNSPSNGVHLKTLLAQALQHNWERSSFSTVLGPYRMQLFSKGAETEAIGVSWRDVDFWP